jgi:hypothetical protein
MVRAVAARVTMSVLFLLLGACTSMHTVPTPTRYIESVRPKLVRITQTDGSRFFMVGVRLQGDTVMGFVQDPKRPMGEFRELPVGSIAKLEAQQYVHTRTALAVLGGFAGWAVVTYLVVRHEDTQSGQVD